MRMQFIRGWLCAIILLLVTSVTHAQVTFVFDTTGTPDAVPGAALTAAGRAATTVSNALSAVNPTYNATIEVQFHFSMLGAGVLGGATPVYGTNAGIGNGYTYDVVAYDKIRYGNDTNGGGKDIIIEMQSDTNEVNWYYGANASGIGVTEDDFESTMIHEIIHSIGWLESMDENGISQNGTGSNPASWGNFDQYLGDGADTFLNTTTFAFDSTGFVNNVTEGTGGVPPNGVGLYFHGSRAMAANGGNPVPFYSPTTYSAGSSVSHLDTNFYTSMDFVMEHAASPGTSSRSITGLELSILRDIYAVPEPSSGLVLILAGLAVPFRRSRVSS